MESQIKDFLNSNLNFVVTLLQYKLNVSLIEDGTRKDSTKSYTFMSLYQNVIDVFVL